MNNALRVIVFATSVLPNVAAAAPELVLYDGARLTAHTSSGVISVLAGSGIARTYEWSGCSLESRMVERTRRWYGSLGVYDPAASYGWPFSIFRICNGVSRTVVAEGQIHFADARAAEDWIHRYARVFPTVWSNDGLLVQWFVSPGREQLSVDVWQLRISGRPPTQLSGATDELLQLSRTGGSGPLRQDCAAVGSDVALETKKAWDEHWRQAGEWSVTVKPQR